MAAVGPAIDGLDAAGEILAPDQLRAGGVRLARPVPVALERFAQVREQQRQFAPRRQRPPVAAGPVHGRGPADVGGVAWQQDQVVVGFFLAQDQTGIFLSVLQHAPDLHVFAH